MRMKSSEYTFRRQHITKDGHVKIQYPSKVDACDARDLIVTERDENPLDLECYQCVICDFWHLGRPRTANIWHNQHPYYRELSDLLGQRVAVHIRQENKGSRTARFYRILARWKPMFRKGIIEMPRTKL